MTIATDVSVYNDELFCQTSKYFISKVKGHDANWKDGRWEGFVNPEQPKREISNYKG